MIKQYLVFENIASNNGVFTLTTVGEVFSTNEAAEAWIEKEGKKETVYVILAVYYAV